jgi:hypothetical protein
MAFFFGLFGSKPVAPERVPTDSVVPLFERDDTRTNRNITLEFTMKFDEVLDAEKLSGALWKLLERPGWRKLGARLRVDVYCSLSRVELMLTYAIGQRQTRIPHSSTIHQGTAANQLHSHH